MDSLFQRVWSLFHISRIAIFNLNSSEKSSHKIGNLNFGVTHKPWHPQRDSGVQGWILKYLVTIKYFVRYVFRKTFESLCERLYQVDMKYHVVLLLSNKTPDNCNAAFWTDYKFDKLFLAPCHSLSFDVIDALLWDSVHLIESELLGKYHHQRNQIFGLKKVKLS